METSFDFASLVQPVITKKSENPFVGLRPFEADESHLFFGRDKQIADLLQKLHTQQFLAIVGSSGCGKSSLIRAGLIPKLKAGFLTEKRDHWIIATFRPSGDPILHFCNAVNEAFEKGKGMHGLQKPDITPDSLLNMGTSGFLQTMHQLLDHQRVNLLVLSDQFEELYTYKTGDEKQKNENTFFVNLLLALAADKELPVYTVITMRSDYIGHCNRFFGLPELLNESQYLVPRLKWQQIREVIEYPIKLYGQEINPGLLDLLTNDSDKELDQLPVLQHCLMRTWQNWMKDGKPHYVEFRHYEKTGGLQGALCKHANDVFDKLDINEQEIARYMFQCISDYNTEYEPVRRPQPFGVIEKVCLAAEGSRHEDVMNVINKFREKSCAFLTPSETVKISDKTIIDISHESLMRQWDRLNGWIRSEQRSAEKLLWLSESVTNHREHLRGWDIKDAMRWQEKQRPNHEWAKRYVGNLQGVKDYIEKSRKSDRRRKWKYYGSISLATLAIITTLVGFVNLKKQRVIATLQKTEAKLVQAESEKERTLLRLKADSAERVSLRANAVRDSLEAANHREIDEKEKIKKDILLTKLLLEKKNAETAAQREIIEKADSIQDVAMSKVLDLTEEKFYQSAKINDSVKRELILELIGIRYKDNTRDSLTKAKKFETLLKALNKASEGLELAGEDPNLGIWLVAKAYDNYHHPELENIFNDMLNEFLFCTLKSGLPLNYIYSLSVDGSFISSASENKELFAYQDADSVRVVRIQPQKISILRTYSIPGNDNVVTSGYVSYDKYRLKGIFFKKDSLFAITSDSVFLKWALNNPGIEQRKLTFLGKNQIIRIFPDGTRILLATLATKKAAIWNFQTNVKEGEFETRSSISSSTFIDISPDGRKILISGSGGLSMYYTENFNKVSAINLSYTTGRFIGNNYIIASSPRERKIKLLIDNLTAAGNEIDLKEISLSRVAVKDIWMAPDWKKLFIKTDEGGIPASYLVENGSGGDSVIFFKSTNASKKRILIPAIKKIPNASGIGFINNDLVITNQTGDGETLIGLWKKYTQLKVSDFNTGKMPFLSISDQVEYGIIDYRELNLETINNEELLNLIADKSLVEFEDNGDSVDLNINYSTYKILAEKYGIKYWKEFDYAIRRVFDNYKDTTKYCNDLKQMIKLGEMVLSAGEKSGSTKNQLSIGYGRLAFWSLFSLQANYDSVIHYALRGLELDPVQNDWINTNLALGYLFSGKYEKAYEIYTNLKDSFYTRDGKSFGEAFIKDLDDLQSIGIITKNKPDFFARVVRLKNFLKGNADTPY